VSAATRQDAAAQKYARITRFVEENSLLAQPASLPAASAWHRSYDEEAEDPEAHNAEPGTGPLRAEAAVPRMVGAACSSLQVGGLGSGAATSVYAMPFYRTRLDAQRAREAALAAKPWYFSYDEEAEGSFGVATAAARTRGGCAGVSGAVAVSADDAVGARHRSVGAHRQPLRAAYGDLEQMQPWVDPAMLAAVVEAHPAAAGSRRWSAAQRYAALMSFAARRGQVLDDVLAALRAQDALTFRSPQAQFLTFDEEAHGEECPATLLGSC
jgi:hypothetical protein